MTKTVLQAWQEMLQLAIQLDRPYSEVMKIKTEIAKLEAEPRELGPALSSEHEKRA